MAKNLLLELGVEELPPLKLKILAQALADEFVKLLAEHQLKFKQITNFCTPRRLAIIVTELEIQQADSENFRRGPAARVAFDTDGNASPALIGFAKSCGVSVSELQTIDTKRGVWYGFTSKIAGKPTAELIPELFSLAINKLPVNKRMRWGDFSYEFVRPVHWLVAVIGNDIIPMEIFGIKSSNKSFGHRFHAPLAIEVNADNYVAQLLQAQVVVDFATRQTMISEQIQQLATGLNGKVKINPQLLDEVTSLVELPVALVGKFDTEFLSVPPEAIVAFMEGHQKFFAVFDKADKLLANFITISNINSREPAQVVKGNEKVIRPRLADALFFWQQDLAVNLDDWYRQLDTVIYQTKLGSVLDKVKRITKLSQYLAEILTINQADTILVAKYCKVDLLSQMVGEFPKLQGIMGKYYASKFGINAKLAVAIEEYYYPKYAGDILPSTKIGQILAIADRVDTLVGIFAIGQIPTGDKDPFGLRRAALGVLRIIIAGNLEINLPELLQQSVATFSPKINSSDLVLPFIMERFKGLTKNTQVFNAVALAENGSILDFINRETALIAFNKTAIVESLSLANKRIANLLKKSLLSSSKINPDLLVEPAEANLYLALLELQPVIKPLVKSADYVKCLDLLATLVPTIDDFFASVMVMVDDENIKNNRLILLAAVRNLFLQVADFSKLH